MIGTEGMPLPQRTWVHATIAIGVVMAVLDGAIANVALPTMAQDLQADPSQSVWIINSYQLAVMVSLLPLSALGDIVGYKRVFCAGLALFTAASLACAASGTLMELGLARAVQGFGAAGIMSVNNALIRFLYPTRLLGRGVSYNALVVAVSAVAGPTVAAAILSWGSWHWLFLVNVPVGTVALVASLALVPKTATSDHPFDVISAGLNAVTFGLLLFAVDSLAKPGWGTIAAAEFAGALVVGTIFVRRQRSLPVPMLPLDLLRIPIFSLSMATSICSFAAQSLAFVSLPFYFQTDIGRSQASTGLLMTAWPLVVAFVSPIAGRLSDRHSAGLLGGIGLAILSVGLAALALLPSDPLTIDIVWRMALCGLGFGIFQSPNNRAIFASAPRSRSGAANGLQATARLVGQTAGAALTGLIFTSTAHLGTTVALLVGAGLAALAGLASSLRTLAPPPPAD
jgi:DHA2 family multidrug resistance protein-like MFS transporter